MKKNAKKSVRQSGSLRLLAAGVCTVAMIGVAMEPISASLLSSAGATTIKVAPATTHIVSSRTSFDCPATTNTGTPTTTSYLTIGVPTVSESGYVPTTTGAATYTGVPTTYTTSTAGTGLFLQRPQLRRTRVFPRSTPRRRKLVTTFLRRTSRPVRRQSV